VNSIRLNMGKWWQTMVISFSKHTAYRLDFFLQIIAPTLVFFFINYNLWFTIYESNNYELIKGYSFNQMISYHAWVMIVGLFAQGHTSFNLAQDIRFGRISSYLIYPFNLWEFHTASFLAFEFLQLFIGAATLVLLTSMNLLNIASLNALFMGIIVSIFVSVFWFTVQYYLGLLSFWLEETWVLRVTFRLVAGFLSGVIIPLDLYPETMVKILAWTPFPYLTYYPVKIFMGHTELVAHSLLVLTLWTAIFILICNLTWKRGIRHYTAAGM
jgi:ABC-2 type transport system permease protein